MKRVLNIDDKEEGSPAETSEQCLERLLAYERLLADISTRLAQTGSEDVDRVIDRILGEIGRSAGVDRSYVFQFSSDMRLLSNTHEWCREGISSEKLNLQNMPSAGLSWWLEQLRQSGPIEIPRVADMPPTAAKEKALLEAQQIQSVLVIPMVAGSRHIGFVGFDAVRAERSWTDAEVRLLRVMAEILAGVLVRTDSERALREQAEELRQANEFLRQQRAASENLMKEAQAARRRAETAQAEIAAREAYFRSLIENASDMVAVISPQGVVRFQSPSSKRVLGLRPEELEGTPALEWIHPEDVPRVAKALQEAFDRPATPVTVEYRFRHQDGSWRTLESIGQSTEHPSEGSLVVVNSRDVSASRQVEEQLRHVQKMEAVGHLAGGVAHDFNNILAVTLMQIDLLLAMAELPAPARDGLQKIRAAAERAANLTRQLLLFSRREVICSRNLDLNGVVGDMAEMLPQILGENIEIQLHPHPEPLLTRADPGMLEQVLVNLAVNAREAMPKGGRLRIETMPLLLDETGARRHPDATPGRHVCLCVSDTGEGISPDVLPRIFEPFFTTKPFGQGTGLGLATVFGIVKQHGGWIEVRSEAGRGATFTVLLPALAEKFIHGAQDRSRIFSAG